MGRCVDALVCPIVCKRDGPDWLRSHEKSSGIDPIAGEVPESSSPERLAPTMIVHSVEPATETDPDDVNLPDFALANQIGGHLPLRVVPVHEGFHEPQLARGECLGHAPARRETESEALLAKDVLASLRAPQRPLLVESVGQSDVDRIDLAVIEEGFVAPVGAHRSRLARFGLRALQRARPYGHEAAIVRPLDGRRDGFRSDPTATQNPPAEAICHVDGQISRDGAALARIVHGTCHEEGAGGRGPGT